MSVEGVVRRQPCSTAVLRPSAAAPRPSCCGAALQLCGAAALRRAPSRKPHTLSDRAHGVYSLECAKLVDELNVGCALLRDLLLGVGGGGGRDAPELRDRLKDARTRCLHAARGAAEALLPLLASAVSEGIPVDSQQLVTLACCTQLLLREMQRCQRLLLKHPCDMAAFYEKKLPRASGACVLDRLVLFKAPPRDYQAEEQAAISRDINEASDLLQEMKEFMPCESNDKDENLSQWNKNTRTEACKFAEEWRCHCGTNVL